MAVAGDGRDRFVVCGTCGAEGPRARLAGDARWLASLEGWSRPSNETFKCPRCRKSVVRLLPPVDPTLVAWCTWTLTAWWSDDYRALSESMTDEEFWRYAAGRIGRLLFPLAA